MPVFESCGLGSKNQLFDAFEPGVRMAIEAHMTPVRLKLGELICEAGTPPQYAYFPEGSVLSLLTILKEGFGIETANIGCEGAFGIFAAMNSRSSFARCVVQFEGPMSRCPIGPLQSAFKTSEHTRDLFVNYTETLMSQVQQTAGCNTLHSTVQRIARWLLMMQDRAGSNDLTYTHDALSNMLGVNRKSVTLAAQSLRMAGLISYQRGTIQVRDRHGLEEASCECYESVRSRFEDFISRQKLVKPAVLRDCMHEAQHFFPIQTKVPNRHLR